MIETFSVMTLSNSASDCNPNLCLNFLDFFLSSLKDFYEEKRKSATSTTHTSSPWTHGMLQTECWGFYLAASSSLASGFLVCWCILSWWQSCVGPESVHLEAVSTFRKKHFFFQFTTSFLNAKKAAAYFNICLRGFNVTSLKKKKGTRLLIMQWVT